MTHEPSASQTVGPFFRIGLEHLCGCDDEAGVDRKGTVTIRGAVLDGEGNPVSDALLEIWHANADGEWDAAEPDASGFPQCFTRAATDDEGRFSFSIPRPGPTLCEREQRQAPHITVLVFARGLLRQLMTRMYFPDEPANSADPLLQLVPHERRETLIARANRSNPGTFDWDVVLQGTEETVFFAW